MQGLQITADLEGCSPRLPVMTQVEALRAACLRAVGEAGLRTVGECFHPFPAVDGEPRGVTGVLLLAESHLAVHTWPELGSVTLDLYVCHQHGDHSAQARRAATALVAAFAPDRVQRHERARGQVGSVPLPQPAAALAPPARPVCDSAGGFAHDAVAGAPSPSDSRPAAPNRARRPATPARGAAR